MDAQEQAWDEEAAERAVAVLKAVADPSRYRLLWALNGRELPVSELARILGAHVAATSQHLAKLRAAGLVTTRREGTRIYYRAASVRGLLEEVQLVASARDDASGPGGTAGQESAAAVPEQSVARGALRRRPALG
ncbi:metalloregulator ArsR/SmtB family transcription factor [Streptomyces sp. NPDC052101]|uniref:ArsR/SmtB family transcription factor n=1 Tax=Streptomyces sp. NPDC052101 TaxID=3155763 RepID=UPI00341B588A